MGIIIKKLVEDAGITLIELVIVMIIISVLAVTVTVQFISLSDSAQTAACVANQSALRTSITIYWSQNLAYPAQIEDLAAALPDGTLPECPKGGGYIMVGQSDVICSLAEHQ